MVRFMAAAVQLTSGAQKSENLATASRLVEEAARRGAQLVVLPELFNCLAAPERIVSQAETIPGPTSTAMSQLASRLRVTLVAGSIAERVEGCDKVFNSSLVFSPDGRQLACYRKIHLFDVDLPGHVTFQESRIMEPGDRLVAVQTAVAKLGQATCYDLRFPELFRRLVDAGTQLFCIPSAFTATTGRDHWEPLLRTRAIENQVYVVAPNQFGHNSPSIQTYGRSMIIDPWGVPLATAADGEGVITAEIDLDREAEIRARLPSLRHRRSVEQFPLES
jgi:predicted amidohydrolase